MLADRGRHRKVHSRPSFSGTARRVSLQVESLEERVPLAGDFGFAHAFGASGQDLARTLAIDDDGNSYIAGDFRRTVDFDPGPGVTNLTASGEIDAFVAKYSPTGALLWVQAFGSTGLDWATDVALDPAGNVWLVGRYAGTVDFDNGIGVANETGVNGNGAFVLKLTSAGAFQWVGTISENLTALAVDPAGNVFVTGQYNGVRDFDPGPGTFTLTSQDTADAFLAKLDNNGGFLWAKSWGGSALYFNGDTAVDVAVDQDGNAYVTGEFMGVADLDPGESTVSVTSSGTHDMYVSKFDTDGNLAWARVIDGFAAPRALAIDSQANVYTTGNLQTSTDFDPGPGSVNLSAISGGVDVFVSKLDTAGNYVWAHKLGGTIGGDGYAIAIDSNDDVYITGQISGPNADFDPGPGVFTLTSAGSTDIFVSRLSSAGLFVRAANIGGTGLDRGRAITVHPTTNDIYIAGQFNGTAEFDPAATTMSRTSKGSDDIFLTRLSQNVIGGKVWSDLNFDGLYDLAEEGLADQSVELWATQNTVIGDADDVLVTVTKTDSAGDFRHSFMTSFDGSFYARFAIPAKHAFSPANVGNNRDIDSDASPVSGRTALLTRNAEGVIPWIDAGMFEVVNNPWNNLAKPHDVNGDGGVTPLDALLIINALNASGAKRFDYPLAEGQTPDIWYDVNDDLAMTPLDALLVINYLNAFGIEEVAPTPEIESDAISALLDSEPEDSLQLSLYGHWLQSESDSRKASSKAPVDK